MSDPSPTNEPAPIAPAPALPIAWEDRARSLFGRVLGTLGSAFEPVRSVPALCSPVVAPAWTFALLSAVPLMLASGFIPYTRTLLFGPAFAVKPMPGAAAIPLWLDATTALGLGGLASLITLLAWALPFHSLLRAFADPRVPAELSHAVALRLVLYRAWLLPFGMFAFEIARWSLPAVDGPGSAAAGQAVTIYLFAEFAFRLLPVVLMLMAAQATAMSLGVSLLGALAVALVPTVMLVVVGLTVEHYMSMLVPAMPLAKMP